MVLRLLNAHNLPGFAGTRAPPDTLQVRQKEQRRLGETAKTFCDILVSLLRRLFRIVERKLEAGPFPDVASRCDSRWQHKVLDLEGKGRRPDVRGFGVCEDRFETDPEAA